MATTLTLLSEVTFNQKAPDGFPSTCPTLDLTATWDGVAKDLLVLRPPGQTVSKIHQYAKPGERAPEPLAIQWKPDGQFLAVGWSDGHLGLIGLESGKGVHSVEVCDPGQAKITHIAWSICDMRKDKSRSLSSIQSSYSEERSGQHELPRDLTFVEIDTALPKISALPSASAGSSNEASIFASRVEVEALFQIPKPEEYDQVSAVLVGTDDGRLLLSICDSFKIGYFEYPKIDGIALPQMIHHASHSLISTHVLLLASEANNPTVLQLVPMDLPFISSSPINMSLLASNLTTLHKLLRYLLQTIAHMETEFKNTRELPTRFLNSMESDLAECPTTSVVTALFHTALAGHVYEPVREWLVDSLGDRGHKRWDKAVASGLEALRGLAHENWLPALERCSIILSRLRGLASFYDSRDDIGFSLTEINRLSEVFGALTFLGHKILVMAMDELEGFRAFSTWLKFQIDRATAPESAGDSLTEKEALLDTSKVLTYIQNYLMNGPMRMFFGPPGEDVASLQHQLQSGENLSDLMERQVALAYGRNGHPNALVKLSYIMEQATGGAARIFDKIAEAQKRSVRFGKPMSLSIGKPIGLFDTTMEAIDEKGGIAYAALVAEESRHEVVLVRTGVEVVNGISMNLPPTACVLDLSPRSLLDVKFLGHQSLFTLCSNKDGTPALASLSLSKTIEPQAFGPFNGDDISQLARVATAALDEHSLPEDLGMRPVSMVVHEQSDAKAEIPVRVSLLGKNRMVLRSFTLSPTV